MKTKLNMVKGTVLIVLIITFVLMLFINSTISYLVKEKKRSNVFSLGTVDLSLEEDEFPPDESSRLMYPNSFVPKNPHIINTGTTDEYVFMEVTVPYEAVRLTGTENYIEHQGKEDDDNFTVVE